MSTILVIPKGVEKLTAELVDGRWVIDCEIKKREFKRGDIIHMVLKDSSTFTLIIDQDYLFKKDEGRIKQSFIISTKRHSSNSMKTFGTADAISFELASEAQKQILFDAMEKEGLRWNAEKLEVEKIKWAPKEGEKVFVAMFREDSFKVRDYSYCNRLYTLVKAGIISQTEQLSQDLCDKLNKVLEENNNK